MLVLGLESSCDETAASIVRDGCVVLADIVASQHDVHERYGGVVPELASRAHVRNVVPVIRAALDSARVELDDLDGIAVTNTPGLVGALLVGLQAAKAIAWVTGVPLVGVHHLRGHLAAIQLEAAPAPFPHLALIASGGHTCIVRVETADRVVELGATRDDAAGEAFDKGAKLLGLGYPGGAVIDQLARAGNPQAVAFPRAMTAVEHSFDLSFSGLKTALLHHVRKHGVPDGQELADLCASYQAAIVEVLVRKTRRAARRERLHDVQVCGGVAANSALRAALVDAGAEDDFRVHLPSPKRCTDNGAMIAAAGHHRLVRGDSDPLDLDASPAAPLPRA